MKISRFIMKFGFCIIGLLILVQAFIIFQEERTFIEKANVAQGTVLDISSNNKTFLSVLGLMGSVFFLTGFSFFRSDYLKQKKIQFLKQNGRRIITKFRQLKLNVNEKANGSYPYVICSKWLDPETNKTYLFESENIWLDPTEFDVKNEIMVLIDSNDIKIYHMDISFLPV